VTSTQGQQDYIYEGLPDRYQPPIDGEEDAQRRKYFPYIPDPKLVKAVNLAIKLKRPLLLEGEPGCGKTRLADAIAYEFTQKYLQGQTDDDGKKGWWAYYAWNVKSVGQARDGLYSFDAVARLRDSQLIGTDPERLKDYLGKNEVENLRERLLDKRQYVQMGKLGEALAQERVERPIVLIDEIGKLLAQTEDPSERFRLSALMESLGDLLAQRGLEPLKLRELAERFENGRPLDEDGESIAEVRSRMERAGFPVLKTAEIEYATIAFTESIVEDDDRLQPFRVETVVVDARGREVEKVQQEAYRYIETLPDGLNLEMVAIPSGMFWMGSPESEAERDNDESPQHQVTVQPFFMGRYAVTQVQWRVVAALPQVDRALDPDPSHFKGEKRPVETVERSCDTRTGRCEFVRCVQARVQTCSSDVDTPRIHFRKYPSIA
jgi:nucleoside-triphosphatase THEP1